MSLQNIVDATDYGDASINIATTSRSGIVWGEYIATFTGFPSFAPEIWMDLNLAGTAPLLAGAADNGPSCFTMSDNQDSGSPVALTGLAATWFTRSVECVGPHNGAFQTLRNAVNSTASTATSRFQNNTAVNFNKIRLLGLAGAGRLLGGRCVNVAVVNGSYTDAQIDQMRSWATQYWADTWPSPYSGFVQWSRRLSTNGTTGFGTGDVSLGGIATFSATGDPSITSYSAGATAANFCNRGRAAL